VILRLNEVEAMDELDAIKDRFYVMIWTIEEVLEVCETEEEAEKALAQHQPRVPLFLVVVVPARSAEAAKTTLRAKRNAIDFPLSKLAPEMARLQDYIRAVQAGDAETIQDILNEAELSPALARLICSWQSEHGRK
jgi:hypothetical protein